jgi:microcin C transport system substrate-binding protein
MRRFTSVALHTILSGALVLQLAGCGGGGGQKSASKEARVAIPQEPNLDVTPELGGPGFTGEGWQTNNDWEPTGDKRAVVGGSFTMALTEFPATLRTLGKDSNTEFMFMVENFVYESLIGTHPLSLEFVPALATHWKVSEDKQTYWFRLDPRARFSDGSRVTSADVIATWKLQTDPGILAPYSNMLWGKFDEPVAESPYIVRVHAKELNWKFFLYFGASLTIMPAKYISIPGSQYMTDYQFKMPPGSGLYILDSANIVKGRSLTLRRRDDYWDKDNPKGVGTGNFEKLKWIIVSDERLLFEKFKKGETDFYLVSRAQWWKEETDFDLVKRGLIQKRKIYNDNPQGVQGLVFNMRKPPFNDLRMRKALTHLINREKMISQLFFNEYIPEDSYQPGSIYENPDNPKYRFDPDKAVALLAECGWNRRNAEGWLTNDKNEVLQFELTYSQPSQERYFTVVQEDFKKVGIKLDLKQTTDATMFKMVNERKFLIHWQNWGGLFFPNPENDVSSWTADPDNTNNLAGVKNERIDQLIKEYNVCFDQAKRVEMIREIDKILMEMQPYALGWYAPFTRVLFWDKFGYPEFYLSRTGDWRSMVSYWWEDPEKVKKLEEAKKDENIKLDVGETEQHYWTRYNEKHGRKYEIKGM